MRFLQIVVLSFFCCIVLVGTSCKKEQMLNSGGTLRFSTDTLHFDTVFTAMGSFTLAVKIFNPQNQKISIQSIRLEKGTQSFFRLNVDGTPGENISNIEVAAHDSVYVFATVKIDPNNDTLPFIVEDKLIASLNGNEFAIPLYAYGQNAYYLRDSLITQNTVWHTDKPYVILHSAAVDRGVTLKIPAGCRIYMHADSRLYVLGRLEAIGTKTDSIIFQGDRLDRAYFGYQGYPGEWGGIYFDSSSTGNIMEWCILQNCGNNPGGGLPFAIEVFGQAGIPKQLTLKNTIIRNSIGYGLLSFQGNIEAENCLIHDCGAQALAVLQGGTYSFIHCDFINYLPKKVTHVNQPTVALLNYFSPSETQTLTSNLHASFINCVLYGSLEDEVYFDRANDGNIAYDVSIHNCLLKSKAGLPSFVSGNDNILNTDPEFEDAQKWNFRPKPSSPLIDNGTAAGVSASTDLDGVLRSLPYDIGCYEFH